MIPITTKGCDPSNMPVVPQRIKNLRPVLDQNRQHDYYILVRGDEGTYPEFISQEGQPVHFVEARDLDLFWYLRNGNYKVCEGKTGTILGFGRADSWARCMGISDTIVKHYVPNHMEVSIERAIRQWGLSPRYKWEVVLPCQE